MDLEWVERFMEYHPHLFLRKPHNISVARDTSFNQKNVTNFCNKYKELLVRFKFTGKPGYSFVDTHVAPVLALHFVVQTAVKGVGHVVCAERGQLIIVCYHQCYRQCSITGSFSPHARMHDALVSNAREGSVHVASCQTSGWVTGPLFLKVLGLIKKVTLACLDSHKSQCTVGAILYCTQITVPFERLVLICAFPGLQCR